MSRSTTPTFVVKLFVRGANITPMAWPTKHAGRPSDDTLAEYVFGYETSTRPGGVNAHLGAETVTRAFVARQSTGETVARYSA